jgi:hypothetical protein
MVAATAASACIRAAKHRLRTPRADVGCVALIDTLGEMAEAVCNPEFGPVGKNSAGQNALQIQAKENTIRISGRKAVDLP